LRTNKKIYLNKNRVVFFNSGKVFVMILFISKKRFGSLGPIVARWTLQPIQFLWSNYVMIWDIHPLSVPWSYSLTYFSQLFFAVIEDVTLFQQALQNAVMLPAETVSPTQKCPLTRPFLFVGEDGGIKGSLYLIPATIANPLERRWDITEKTASSRRTLFMETGWNCRGRRLHALLREGGVCIESRVKTNGWEVKIWQK